MENIKNENDNGVYNLDRYCPFIVSNNIKPNRTGYGRFFKKIQNKSFRF
jgi:hypothetical protein